MAEVNYISSLEQVDAALHTALSGLTLSDRIVPVTYYDPDVELTQREEGAPEGYYPAIVLYRQSETPDFTRWSEDPIRDNHSFTDGILTSVDVRHAPEPWNVFYSIRMIAEYQQDAVAMKAFFRKKFPLRYSFLEIEGHKYDVSQVSSGIIGGGHKDFGRVKNGDRMFADVYLIKVEINLDVHERVTKSVATDIAIRDIDIIP